jgi:hypothetical protein
MRVLLKDGAEQATPATILVVDPALAETTLETLSGEGERRGGIVGEVDHAALADMIVSAVEARAAQSLTVPTVIAEVAWMAKVLAPFEVGSRIVQHITQRGCVIDTSEARRTDPQSSITPEERRGAEEADAESDYASLPSRLGRLGDARDATAQSLEELRRRPEHRPIDALGRQDQLRAYDCELTELRAALLAEAIGSSA